MQFLYFYRFGSDRLKFSIGHLLITIKTRQNLRHNGLYISIALSTDRNHSFSHDDLLNYLQRYLDVITKFILIENYIIISFGNFKE